MQPNERGPVLSVEDPRFIKATRHPLRLRILTMLAERKLSPLQLSKELGSPLGTTAYHVKVLAELGLIDLVNETRVRGAVAHHYRARPLPTGIWADASAIATQSEVGVDLMQLGQRVLDEAALGRSAAGSAVLLRREMRLDAEGRRRVQHAVAKLEKELETIGAESDGDPVVVITAAFDAPGSST